MSLNTVIVFLDLVSHCCLLSVLFLCSWLLCNCKHNEKDLDCLTHKHNGAFMPVTYFLYVESIHKYILDYKHTYLDTHLQTHTPTYPRRQDRYWSRLIAEVMRVTRVLRNVPFVCKGWFTCCTPVDTQKTVDLSPSLLFSASFGPPVDHIKKSLMLNSLLWQPTCDTDLKHFLFQYDEVKLREAPASH